MSSVIVQMLPSLTLEPAGMGAAARAPSTVLLHRRGLGALEFSPVPQQCALQLNWECVPLLPPLAVCCPEPGVQLPQPQLPQAPCTHCQGQTLPWGPGPGLGHAGQEGEFGNAPGHAAPGLGLALSGMVWAPTCSHEISMRRITTKMSSVSNVSLLVELDKADSTSFSPATSLVLPSDQKPILLH